VANEQENPDPRFDIAAWKDGFDLYAARAKQSTKEDPSPMVPSKMLRLRRVDPRLAYALFVEFISPHPNGFYTQMLQGLPVDNPIWWDFFLGHEEYLIDISSGVNGMEAHIFSAPEGFEVERFLLASTAKYESRINARANAYERHEVWVNHYRSYRESLKWLRDEVSTLSDAIPEIRGGFFESHAELDTELKTLEDFQQRVIRFHVLAKSLLVNAAFMCEALVSTLLRIAALGPLKQDPETLLQPILRAPFTRKLQVLHAYTVAFLAPIDMNNPAVKNAQKLMDMRNQYVHSELAEHSRLPDVYFDGMFPLYGGGGLGQLGAYAQRAYLTPSKRDVLGAAETAFAFDAFIRASVRPELHDRVAMHLEQAQISYNTEKRVYSVVFPRSPFQFHMTIGEKEKENEE
jgi:hypothetical protein